MRRWAMWGIVIVFAAGFISRWAGCAPVPDQSAFVNPSSVTKPLVAVVQLRCARVPWLPFVHCWFASYEPSEGCWHRWEVWQNAGESANDWGHVRKDLMGPESGVGAGASWVLAEWTLAEAERLSSALSQSPQYPYRDQYHYWPGPNSNTYAAWILKRAEVPYRLPCGAVGKGY